MGVVDVLVAFDVTLVVLAAVALLLSLVGVLLDHAEQNWVVWIRTLWTLSSTEVERENPGAGSNRTESGVALRP